MERIKIVKNQPDFVVSLLFLGLGLFLAFNQSITGEVLNALGGFWARPSTYVRIMGWGLIIFSTVLFLLSLNWTKSSEIKKIKMNIGFEAAVTAGVLVIYCAIMPIITFFPATFLLVFVTNLLFKRKEDQRVEVAEVMENGAEPVVTEGMAKTKGSFDKKSLMISAIYSLSVTLVAWVVFTQFLKAVLP